MKQTVKRISAFYVALLLVVLCMIPILPSGRAHADGTKGRGQQPGADAAYRRCSSMISEKEEAGGCWYHTETNVYESEDSYSGSRFEWIYDASAGNHSQSYRQLKYEDRSVVESGKSASSCSGVPGVLYAQTSYTIYGSVSIDEYTFDLNFADGFRDAVAIYDGVRYEDPLFRSQGRAIAHVVVSPNAEMDIREASGTYEFTMPKKTPYNSVYTICFYGSGSLTEWVYEWTEEDAAAIAGTTREQPGHINQETVTPGKDTAGEDDGTDIIAEIVEGAKENPDAVKGAAAAAGGAIAAGGVAALIDGRKKGGRDGAKKKKKPSGYRMYVNKDFGNIIKKEDGTKYVYARIAELPSGGGEVSRDDLTSKIEVLSGDGVLDVRNGGMTSTGYMTAAVKVPEGCTAGEGCVTFRYTGEGGTFTRHVVFALAVAQVIFPQENLGLPACKLKYVVGNNHSGDSRIGNGEYILPFYVKDMPEDSKVSAIFERVGSTDVRGNFIPASQMEQPVPYTVEITKDREYAQQGIFNAVIREIGEYELGAGVSEGFALRITSEYGSPGSKEYVKAENTLPVYRIHIGLAFTVRTNSIPCYLKLKPGRENKNRDDIMPQDIEVPHAVGTLLLFLCDETNLSIIRVPVNPERDKFLKLTPTRVGNDRYCRTGDAGADHQKLVDALGIRAFATGETDEKGAHLIKLCSTKGSMDPPTRILADVEITAVYQGKTYTGSTSVLLRSQEFRVARNSKDERIFLEKDKHIEEQLLRISMRIEREYPLNLFSLGNMIDRMLEGYDYRFGYDENQVQNVMRIWVGFLEGSFAGANGTPQGVTYADELAACYAFMQGLRDNTGILGRIAMGVMTAGYSEYVFTTMTLAEKLQEKVYACSGDEFGFWDGVVIGVEEFGKQILLELAVQGITKGIGKIHLDTNVTIADKLAAMGGKYRAAMDSADKWMKENVSLYKMGDDALQGVKNFFNSSAKAAKAGIDETIQTEKAAVDRGEKLLQKSRKELLLADEYDDAMAEGMDKLRRLQKAQQDMEAATDAARLKEARVNYRKAADEVWTDKNALVQLQRNQHTYAQRMRAQFNRYRETLLDEVQLEALSDIARETGIPKDNLYVMNASNGSRAAYKAGKKVPKDRDISIKQKVLSDRSKDLTIDQSIGEKAVARRLFRKMNGRDANSIEEALEFMKGKDVTYVHPEGDSASRYVFEHNLEGYEDLAGMTGIKPDGSMDKSLMKNDLHNLQINRAAVEHKGTEWFKMSESSAQMAQALEAEASGLSGEAAEALLKRAAALKRTSQGQAVEGVYQITKQVENIITPRGILRTGQCPLSAEAMEIHQAALRVGYDVSPAVFKQFLQSNYGLTMKGYAKYMSKFLN